MLGWFRRHAKILMVVLGSAAMAIFGLGPVFDTFASRGGRGGDSSRENEIIATWKGGEISRVNLDQMERQHYQALRFLDEVRKQAAKKKGDVYRSLALPINPIQDGKREMVDDQLITRYLMAERAKEEGVVVSDGMVSDYIALFSGDAQFSNRDLEEINTIANDKYCSLDNVNERLKLELLANQMQLCTMSGVTIVPNPSEAIQLYGRTMSQIECEALPIEIEQYVGKVSGEPTPAELKKLYEDGKFEFPDPTGIRPGFKIGRKLNLQYLIADYDTFLKEKMDLLHEADIQKEYDRLVAEKNDMVMQPIQLDDTIDVTIPPVTENGDVTPPPAEGEAAPSDVGAPPVEGNQTPAETTTPETTTTTTPGASTPEVEAPEATTTPAVEAPVETPAVETPAGETPVEGGGNDQSFKVRSSKFQFVSTRQEEATKKPDPADESATPAATQTEPAVTQTEPAVTQTEPAVTTPAETAAQDEPGGIGGIMEDADAIQADDKPVDNRKPKLLKDCVEDVKKSMCEEEAFEAMKEAITKAEVIMLDYFEKREQWDYDEDKKKGPAPTPPNIDELAKKYGLMTKESGLVDDIEIQQDTLGAVRIFMQVMRQGRQMPQLVPVGQLIFNEFSELRLYDSQTVSDMSQNNYLFWATEKADTRVPSLGEAEAGVIKFWKSQKALEMALAEAQDIRKKVNDVRSKKMSELYPGKAFSTGAFTWFSSFGGTRYGAPIGVTNAGDEFMQVAFSLENLEAGVATNESKDVVYVIQSLSDATQMEEVGMDYLENKYFRLNKQIPAEVMRVSQLYFQELNLNWNQEFKDTMNLKFIDR